MVTNTWIRKVILSKYYMFSLYMTDKNTISNRWKHLGKLYLGKWKTFWLLNKSIKLYHMEFYNFQLNLLHWKVSIIVKDIVLKQDSPNAKSKHQLKDYLKNHRTTRFLYGRKRNLDDWILTIIFNCFLSVTRTQ